MLLKLSNIEDRYSQVHLSKCFELYREEVSFVKKIEFTLWHKKTVSFLNSFQIEDDLLD
jgi:hypothetical protein